MNTTIGEQSNARTGLAKKCVRRSGRRGRRPERRLWTRSCPVVGEDQPGLQQTPGPGTNGHRVSVGGEDPVQGADLDPDGSDLLVEPFASGLLWQEVGELAQDRADHGQPGRADLAVVAEIIEVMEQVGSLVAGIVKVAPGD